MTKKADVSEGAEVEWKWGKGKGAGKVTKVHEDDVEKSIKGSRVKRTASKEVPAAEVETDKGAKVLKSTSEVKVR